MTTKTFAVALGLSCVATFLLLGCEQEPTILPGHSRPLLEHDWPHPRDYVFEPSSFQPPDPEPARLEAASGLRAYVITDTSDPLVRVTAAVPIGRLYEREGEAGASEALARALTDGGRGSPPLSLRLETLASDRAWSSSVDWEATRSPRPSPASRWEVKRSVRSRRGVWLRSSSCWGSEATSLARRQPIC